MHEMLTVIANKLLSTLYIIIYRSALPVGVFVGVTGVFEAAVNIKFKFH